MMSKLNKVVLCVSALLVLSAPSVWAAGFSLDLMGANTYNFASGTPSISGGLSNTYGGGLALDFKMGGRAAFTLGALYLNRTDTIGGVAINTGMYEPYAGFQFFFSRVVYVEIGMYDNIYTANGLGASGTDYGFYAGLGFRFPLGGSIALLVDFRYDYALNTLNYPGGTITPNQGVGLVGLSFGGGSSAR